VGQKHVALRKKRTLSQILQARKKAEMLSVHDPNAEEILDAEVIKFASRPANLRPNAEEILDAEVIKLASRPANPRQVAQNARIKSAFCKSRPRSNPSQLKIF